MHYLAQIAIWQKIKQGLKGIERKIFSFFRPFDFRYVVGFELFGNMDIGWFLCLKRAKYDLFTTAH
jgi:hypothetical protein